MKTSLTRVLTILGALTLPTAAVAQEIAPTERNSRHSMSASTVAQLAYLKASNTNNADLFGTTALSGNTLVIGASGEASSATGVNGNQADNSLFGSGAVYVYVRSGSSWVQQAYLKASNPDLLDRFGWSVAIDGDTLVVGAPSEDSGADGVNGNQADNTQSSAGAAYVFVRAGTTWTQQAYLKAHNSGESDRFGESVDIHGDTIVIGAYAEDSSTTGVNPSQNNSASDAGAAYVFARNGSTWSQQAFLKASNTTPGAGFGEYASIHADTIAVSAGYEKSSAIGINGNQADQSAPNAGAVYIFQRSGSSWTQQAYVKASNTQAMDRFGFSTALHEDLLVVGAIGEDSTATGVQGNQANNGAALSGAAYVFRRNGSTWSQESYLKASNTNAGDYFGSRIVAFENLIAIAASRESSASTGVNGGQGSNTAVNSGAVYLFEHDGSAWAQHSYIKASNTQLRDYFGASLALEGTTLVIMANEEDSAATGLNGNQADNSATEAGAAYVFQIQNSGSAYCFGDGSGTPCPCHDGASGRGCENDFNDGARLDAFGAASFELDTFRLEVFDVPPGSAGICLKGSTVVNGGLGNVVGDGLLCLTPQLRSQVIIADSPGGTISMTQWNGQPFGTHTNAANVGASTYYQWWYRDAANNCSGQDFNFSNGWVVDWQ